MNLSKNFTLSEMVKSETALRKGIQNIPQQEHIEALKLLAENILQPCRDYFNKPIKVTSGYRTPELCIAIDSRPTSEHTKGIACDIELVGGANIDLLEYIITQLPFNAIISEYLSLSDPYAGWVHVSYIKETQNKILFKDHKIKYHRKTLQEIKELIA